MNVELPSPSKGGLKGGLIVGPDGTIFPPPEFSHPIGIEGLFGLTLRVLDSFADALERGNQSGMVEQIAGSSQYGGTTTVIGEIPSDTVLETRRLTKEELEQHRSEQSKSPRQKYEEATVRVRAALAIFPDLSKKRVENLLREIQEGSIPITEDDNIKIDEALRPIISATIRNLFPTQT